jgi:Secretion system C-terminal sorting domain
LFIFEIDEARFYYMKQFLLVFFAFSMLSSSLKAQQSKWVIGSGQQDSSGNWNLFIHVIGNFAGSNPNPATNEIQLWNSLTDGIINYFIYAIDGQCMESGAMNKVTKSISLGDYQKGIYVIEFLAKNEHSYRKFVKD